MQPNTNIKYTQLLQKINVAGNWHQQHDIVDMSFKAKKLVESLEEKFNL